MSTPKLALCIPAFNAARFLPRLLRSAATQLAAFDEIIVCDDASVDDTKVVARSFGAMVIINPCNCGCSAAKNRALAASSSDWIHFHDADDELLPGFTTLAHRWMSRPDCPDVVLFDYEYRDNETNELIARSNFDSDALASDPVRYAILNQINPFCGLYRRDRLLEVGGYDIDPEILYNEDVAFHCKLALAGLSFGVEKEVTIINYRIHDSMSRSNQVRCLKAHHCVLRRLAFAVGTRYPAEIASKLWAAATAFAAYGQTEYMDAALEDARMLYSGIPVKQSFRFAALCHVFGPSIAFRLRENAIRAFKPALRRSFR